MTLYALVIQLCLLDGNCYTTMPEAYYDMESCKVEVVHQVAQGVPKDMLWCEEVEE